MGKLHARFSPRPISGRMARYCGPVVAAACIGHTGIAIAEKESAAKPMTTVETTQSFKGEKVGKPDQNAPPQANSTSPEAVDVQPGNAWWEHAEGDSPLRRFIKLFYGPDRPPGPDPDVDTNISAGGAGGG
jgi:hypothetical protein